jgi:DNA-binding transcriptional regulator GbsR (MarR family)
LNAIKVSVIKLTMEFSPDHIESLLAVVRNFFGTDADKMITTIRTHTADLAISGYIITEYTGNIKRVILQERMGFDNYALLTLQTERGPNIVHKFKTEPDLLKLLNTLYPNTENDVIRMKTENTRKQKSETERLETEAGIKAFVQQIAKDICDNVAKALVGCKARDTRIWNQYAKIYRSELIGILTAKITHFEPNSLEEVDERLGRLLERNPPQ